MTPLSTHAASRHAKRSCSGTNGSTAADPKPMTKYALPAKTASQFGLRLEACTLDSPNFCTTSARASAHTWITSHSPRVAIVGGDSIAADRSNLIYALVIAKQLSCREGEIASLHSTLLEISRSRIRRM